VLVSFCIGNILVLPGVDCGMGASRSWEHSFDIFLFKSIDGLISYFNYSVIQTSS